VPAIRPPTVPPGTARLRISLSAAHTPDDITRLTDNLLRIEALQ
jgi:8-amino-7-oxononanoate synthase